MGHHFFRGELDIAQELTERALRVAEDQERIADGALLRAFVGAACLFRGDLRRARSFLETALHVGALDEQAEKGQRPSSGAEAMSVAAMHLALAEWHAGDSLAARRLIEHAEGRAREVGGAAPAVAMFFRAILEARRSDPAATLTAAERTLTMASDSGMGLVIAMGAIYKTWAIGRLRDAAFGARELHQALNALVNTGVRTGSTYFHGLVADLETLAGDAAAALEEINEGLAISAELGEHWTDPYLHWLRGDVLLKQNPSNPAAAEEAYRTAIAIAKQQGARSYELLASLSLAKLYQSTGRPADAYTVLAPALEGFAPTLEMPEIAEAQTLMERLA